MTAALSVYHAAMSLEPTLIDLLSPERLIVANGDQDKWSLINELVDRLPDGGGFSGDLEQARRAVFDREEKLTTGLELGVALPHGILPAPVTPAGVLAVCPAGLSFESLDGEPTFFVLLMIFGDDTEGRDRHLLSLSQSVSLFTRSGNRERILDAASSSDLYRVLEQLVVES